MEIKNNYLVSHQVEIEKAHLSFKVTACILTALQTKNKFASILNFKVIFFELAGSGRDKAGWSV